MAAPAMRPAPLGPAGLAAGRPPAGNGRPPRRLHIAGYSRFVSVAKVVLPLIALVLVSVVAAWPHLKPKNERFRIGVSNLAATEGEDPNMVNARYVGTDEQDRPFTVTADYARRGGSKTPTVELEMPKADLTLEDGTWLVLTAKTGVYDQAAKTLKLAGAVNLFHDLGYEIRTDAADVDIGKGMASGRDPVAGQGPFGELRAQGFQLKDRGKVIVFTGRAYLLFYPGAQGGRG
jgi:lipopolysaccharide export system protein LptC